MTRTTVRIPLTRISFGNNGTRNFSQIERAGIETAQLIGKIHQSLFVVTKLVEKTDTIGLGSIYRIFVRTVVSRENLVKSTQTQIVRFLFPSLKNRGRQSTFYKHKGAILIMRSTVISNSQIAIQPSAVVDLTAIQRLQLLRVLLQYQVSAIDHRFWSLHLRHQQTHYGHNRSTLVSVTIIGSTTLGTPPSTRKMAEPKQSNDTMSSEDDINKVSALIDCLVHMCDILYHLNLYLS